MSTEAQESRFRARDVETIFTRDFVIRSLRLRAKRVLEVGCGSGELAATLVQNGLTVVAIDADHDSVAAAQRLGVDARVATWPDFGDGCFDAVLFTRSLHHIHPLVGALTRAADTLHPGGRLIVEDFAYEAVDEPSLRWFRRAIEKLKRENLLQKDNEFLSALRSNTKTVIAWAGNHETELHQAAEMEAEIVRLFSDARREDVPYFFRYLVKAIAKGADRHSIVSTLAAEEAALIAKGKIVALGRRFVGTKSASGKNILE